MEEKKKIRVLPKGPYEVIGGVPLLQEVIEPDEKGISKEWKKGKKYESKNETYHLCRCGRSKNKPFCDGTHTEVHFDGKETAANIPYDEAAVVYKGPRADLLDQENLCAVARFCDRGLQVWNLIEKDDEASLQMAVEEACNCPAGRLTVVDKQGKKIEPNLEQEISVVQDPVKNSRGPLWVKGGIEIEGAEGQHYEVRNRVTLCRCGESTNMPFCDASHLSCPHMKGQDN